MNRRKFFKAGALTAIGSTLLQPLDLVAAPLAAHEDFRNKKAKNIIVLVSDGMSSGTLNMAHLYAQRILGRSTKWIELYEQNLVSRGLMDMASASSIVTDSAAASSSWGCGERVNNGSINVSTKGEPLLPIWQKFKKAGKKAGIVTTVPATHATPAGFTVSLKSRNDQTAIAEEYLRLEYDVIMGGGNQYFDAATRKDKKDMYAAFQKKGYAVSRNKKEMQQTQAKGKKLLGIFDEDALPYAIDRMNTPILQQQIPTLAEMAHTAIESMKDHPQGFVLQIESGKVDWAAHANDIAGLIHEQLQFDDALKVAIEFAQKDKETLVIITTDHGNANPGIIYGKNANNQFDSIAQYKQTNEVLLNSFSDQTTSKQLTEYIAAQLGMVLQPEDAQYILNYYHQLEKQEDGLYNYKKLPYKGFAEIQKKYDAVGWISMDHSADFVEIAMYGPGQSQHLPFMKNTDLHHFMLRAAEVENSF